MKWYSASRTSVLQWREWWFHRELCLCSTLIRPYCSQLPIWNRYIVLLLNWKIIAFFLGKISFMICRFFTWIIQIIVLSLGFFSSKVMSSKIQIYSDSVCLAIIDLLSSFSWVLILDVISCNVVPVINGLWVKMQPIFIDQHLFAVLCFLGIL